MIADDRRRSQKIEHGSIFCDRLRSSAITIAGSQAIAEVCFHMIADDRRTFCDLRSAIRDRLRSYGNQPLRDARGKVIEYLNRSHRNSCLLRLNSLTLSMTKTGRDNKDIYWAKRQERANYNECKSHALHRGTILLIM